MPSLLLQAYRELARKCHPDKGGDPASFARVQNAFETLSTQAGRAVYDEWAREVQYRYVRKHSQQAGRSTHPVQPSYLVSVQF